MPSRISKLRSILTVVALSCAILASSAFAQTANPPLGIHNIIQSVEVVGGNLVARTTQGQVVPIGLTAQRQPGVPCPILNLQLGPIDLNLLGLVVQTSPICLDLTAHRGQGALLGNLLCSIARLLDRGVPLQQVLADLTAEQVNQLTSGLRDILNASLNQLNQAVVTAVRPGAPGCTILDLSLGPLELNLLGLVVDLNNCAGGPVTVTITAVPGALLGDLLCGVLGGVTPGTTLQQVLQLILARILAAI